MHALQILGSFVVVAAFASCAFDNGSLRWASLALLACILGTVIEFVLGAWPLGIAAGVVAGRRWRQRVMRRRGNAAQGPIDNTPPHDLHPRS
jgi:biotin transporter BioY